MVRKKSSTKELDVKRGAWTAHEDKILYDYIMSHGIDKWRSLPVKAGLNRCGKSCRLRWLNYLRPDIKRGNITEEEEDLIIRLHKLLGNRWSLIAGRIPGRTDNEIKNYWNTCLQKKLVTKNSSPPSDTKIRSNNSTSRTYFNVSEEAQCSKPRVNTGSFSYDGSNDARMSNNGELHREGTMYPLLDENNVWDPFSF